MFYIFFQIELPDDKQLFHRLFEMVTTFDAGKYTPTDPVAFETEPDDNCEDELWLMALSNAKQMPSLTTEASAPSTSSRRSQNKKKNSTASTPTTSKKDINSAHQNFVKQVSRKFNNEKIFVKDKFQMDQATLQQNYLLMQAANQMAGNRPSSNAEVVAQIAQLQAILQLSTPGATNAANFNKAIEDALNLSKKDTPSTPSSSSKASATTSTPTSSQKSTNATAAAASSSSAGTSASGMPQLNSAEMAAFEKAAVEQLGIGFSELMILQTMDPSKPLRK